MYTVISATNRVGSNTIKIALQYLQLLKEKGIEAKFLTLEGLDINERNEGLVKVENDLLIPAEKFVIITPEYNGSFPGVFKAMMDNNDIEKVWWKKKALLVGVSTGRAGNLRGMEDLTGVLHYLKVVVHPNKLPISIVNKLLNKDGFVEDKATLRAINEQLDDFIRF
ncbi:MAG: NADPH-dependent FMN reductase [Bacteroidetes bacterium]|nr:MAG: NADPH-dependent FMN reductase [Bacteroidota bacterium]